MNVQKDTPIRFLKGVGEAKGNKLAALGLFTAGDLAEFFPRRYEFRGEIQLLAEAEYGVLCATVLTVCSAPKTGRGGSGVSYIRVNACDESGTATLTFFNQPWLEKSLISGRKYRVWGRVRQNGYSFEITAPEIEPYSDGMPPVLPVYPLTRGLTQQLIRRIMPQVSELIESLPSVVPDEVRARYGLLSHAEAVYYLQRSVLHPKR